MDSLNVVVAEITQQLLWSKVVWSLWRSSHFDSSNCIMRIQVLDTISQGTRLDILVLNILHENCTVKSV